MNRIAVYAGSFDPPTLGHLDIVKKVGPLFDKVYLLVAENTRKKSLFSAQERQEMLAQWLASKGQDYQHVEAKAYRGLVVDFCKAHQARVLIRGLRAISDFDGEFQIANMNRRLAPEIETLHIMADEKYLFLSSSLVKEVAYHSGSLKDLVPQVVEEAIERKRKEGLLL